MTNPNQAHIDSLAQRIAEARDAYYNGKPIMSDAAFDAIEDDLRKLDPTNAVFQKVGAPVGGTWPTVKHEIPMGSLNKAQVLSEVETWHASVKSPLLVVMDKLDGASLELVYENRRLVRAVTRGDGLTGDEITRNVLLMKGVVKTLPPTIAGNPTPAKTFVRGEVVVKKSDFAVHFKGESNPRNTANGTMKRQSDASKCAHLTVIAYQILPGGEALPSKSAELKELRACGFETPRWSVALRPSDVDREYQDYVARIRGQLDYIIDGLVLSVDDKDAREAEGDLGGRPKAEIAFKFPHSKKPTILRNVEWQVGNSGRITPVAVFDAVDIDGKSIERASLAGIRQVERLKLYPGCTVLVALRNDVIPRIEANVSLGLENDE